MQATTVFRIDHNPATGGQNQITASRQIMDGLRLTTPKPVFTLDFKNRRNGNPLFVPRSRDQNRGNCRDKRLASMRPTVVFPAPSGRSDKYFDFVPRRNSSRLSQGDEKGRHRPAFD